MKRILAAIVLATVVAGIGVAVAAQVRYPIRMVFSGNTPPPPVGDYFPATSTADTSLGGWSMAGATVQRSSYATVTTSDSTGPVKWYRPIEAHIDGTTQIVTYEDKTYVATAKGLVVLNSEDGSTACRFDTELPTSTPSIDNDVVYLPSMDHYLYALNSSTCALIWKFQAAAGFSASPLPSLDRVFIPSRDGIVHAITMATGVEAWSYQTAGNIFASPCGDLNVMYVAASDAYGYAINATTGTLVWKTAAKLPGTGNSVYWCVVYGEHVIWNTGSPYRYNHDVGSKAVSTTFGATVLGHSTTNGRYFMGPAVNDPGCGVAVTCGVGTISTSTGAQGWPTGGSLISTTSSALTNGNTLASWVSDAEKRTYAYIDKATGGETTHLPMVQGAQTNEVPFDNHPGVVEPNLGAFINLSTDISTLGNVTGNRAGAVAWKDTSTYLKVLVNNTQLIAADEPAILSGSGGKIFYKLCCDREGGRLYPTTAQFYTYSGDTMFQRHLPSTWPTDAEDNAIPTASIVSSSIGNPSTITTSAPVSPALTTGMWVRVNAHTPNNGVNGLQQVTVVDSTHFTVPVNVTVAGTGGNIGDLCDTDAPDTNDPQCSPTGIDFDEMVRPFSTSFERLATYYVGKQSTRSGEYSLHSYQNPIVPTAFLNGSSTRVELLMTHNSNAVIAFGQTATDTGVAYVTQNDAPTNTASTQTSAEIIARVEAHLDPMLDLFEASGTAGFLNPEYGIGDYSTSNTTQWPEAQNSWMRNPADTIWALSEVYPYLSAPTKVRVAAYLASYYSTMVSPTIVRTVGFQRTQREEWTIPSAVITKMGTSPHNADVTTGTVDPRLYYALWKYVANVVPANAVTVFAAVKGVIPSNSGLDVSQAPMGYNKFIDGYRAILELQALCVVAGGGTTCTSGLNISLATVTSSLATMVATRTGSFSAEHPWLGNDPWLGDNPSGTTTDQGIRRFNCARNWLYMSKELGTYMAASATASTILSAIELYEHICPVWFKTMANEGWQETGSMLMHPFDAHGIFLAKAYVAGESQQELSKWLDVPRTRGDVYWLLNAAATLQAPLVGAHDIEAPSTAIQLSRYEVSFQVDTVATNIQMPYTASPPTGIPAGYGVSVDLEFSTDTSYGSTQPCFYYQDFTYQVKSSHDWIQPATTGSWKCRVAFPTAGTWNARIKTTDSNGTTTSASWAVTVSSSASHGFLRVSTTDARYLEYTDGTPFFIIGFNDQDQWDNPISSAITRYGRMGAVGANWVRKWLAPGSIYGSSWNGWYEPGGGYGGNIPTEGLETLAGSVWPNGLYMRIAYGEASGVENSNTDNEACRLTNTASVNTAIGGGQNSVAIEPSTTYGVYATVRTFNLTGPRTTSAHSNYGFVLKVQNPSDGTFHTSGSTACWRPGSSNSTGQVISSYLHDNASSFAVLQGTWTSPSSGVSSNIMPPFYLALENVCARTSEGGTCSVATLAGTPSAYISEVHMYKLDGGSPVGPDLMATDFSSLTHFNQKNSYEFDKVVEEAEDNGVHIQAVVSEFQDLAHGRTLAGTWTSPADVANFYSTSGTAARYLHNAYWRYLQARYGYSTAIAAWEDGNEGAATTTHREHANSMATYMHTFTQNKHLAWTSTPSGLDTTFWNNASFQAHDVRSIHWYPFSSTPGSVTIGAAIDTVNAALSECNSQAEFETCMSRDGALSQQETRQLLALSFTTAKPIVRDETGPDTTSFAENPSHYNDTQCVWWHNQQWAQLDNGIASLPWWTVIVLDNAVGPDGSSANGCFEVFSSYATFVSNIPINNGHYVAAAPTVSVPSVVRALGQKDATNHRAHLWVQNRKHIWCAVLDAVDGMDNDDFGGPDTNDLAGCPTFWNGSSLSGTVTVGGFANSTSYTVQYTSFNESGVATVTSTTQASDGSGNMVIDLDPLADTITDVGIKIGTYP